MRYSIARVCFVLAVGLSAALAWAGGYTDGFEGSSLNPYWSTQAIPILPETSGFVTFPSPGVSHSGNRSVQFTTTVTSQDKTVGIYHDYGQAVWGTVSVWMYDTGAGNWNGNYMGMYISTAPQGGALMAGINTPDWNGSVYGYYDFSGGFLSSVSRTAAWHQLTIDDRATGLTLSIDGNVFYSNAGAAHPFQVVSLALSGPSWRPAMTTYFDDFQANVTPTGVPLPGAAWGGLALLGVLCAARLGRRWTNATD